MLTPNADRLLNILSHKRPHFSDTDEYIIYKTFGHLAKGAHDATGLSRDKFGNRYYTIPTPDGLPKIIWACHSDTVHREYQTMKGIYTQKIVVDKDIIKLADDEKDSNCLGGDDGVGMWLLSEMIANGVPGKYIIHRGEERGCLGSEYIINKMNPAAWGYDACVSLDRKGTTEVITHQMSIRRCSDAFAHSFVDALGMTGVLKPSTFGIYTDSANYYKIIPECANVSVGYDNAHSKEEFVDLAYVNYLRDHLCSIDLAKIVIARDPKAIEAAKTSNMDWSQCGGRFYGPREDGRWWDRDRWRWITTEEKAGQDNGKTLLDANGAAINRGGPGRVIDLRPGHGFRSKDDGRCKTKKEHKLEAKLAKQARRVAALAKREVMPYTNDWRAKYANDGPAIYKIIFCDQLTKFVNRHAREFAEAVVHAGWTPEDVLTMMFDKHGKMYDIDHIER